LRQFQPEPALAETDVVGGVRVREEREELPTVATATAPAAINTLVCVFILLYPFSSALDGAEAGKVTVSRRLLGKQFSDFGAGMVNPHALWISR
jgi:hypothetical protein